MRRTKLDMVLDIVNWEHRYKYGHLESGAWCIERIRELMCCREEAIRRTWLDTSGETDFFRAIGKPEEN